MSNTTIDSSQLLAEKLSLAREIASLKPEINDLRSQVQANEGLLAEKLSLARQVKTLEAELKDERHAVESRPIPSGSHAAADALKEEISNHKAQAEKLKKELTKTRRDLDTTQKELETLQHDVQKSEKSDTTEDSINAEKLREVRAELAREKRERAKAEKQVAQAVFDTDSDKAVLEDKLNQFRAKLRSTKEKLKGIESELLEARNTNNVPSVAAEAKNPRKRAFVQIDPDAAIGTPGDANTKRNKQATSVLGEKSNFSITPFLNKTTTIAGGRHQDDPVTSIETGSSPSRERQRVKRPEISQAKKPNVLGPASPSKSNSKVAPVVRQRAATKPKLAVVAEDRVMDENDEPPRPLLSKGASPKPLKQILKPKSLASFSSFRDGSAPPQQIPQKMHKRKLLGGGSKTIFDDDDEAGGLPFGGFNSKIGAQRVLGIGGRSLGGLGVLGSKRKGPIVVADGDFQFSPLKRDRRAASVLASG